MMRWDANIKAEAKSKNPNRLNTPKTVVNVNLYLKILIAHNKLA